MGNQLFISVLAFLQTVSPVYIMLAEFFAAYAMVLLIFRFYGREGLLAYITMATIIANIQVLKLVQFPFYAEPIALGTVVFVSSFLAVQIINEHYGKDAALQAVKLSFVGYFCFMLLMALSLAFTPFNPKEALEAEYATVPMVQGSLEMLFTPAPSIFVSSLLALLAGQLLNVYVFSRLMRRCKGKMLWVRGLIASSAGNLVDNTVFSVFAFAIFAKNPLDWKVLLFSYILGVFVLRFVLALLETPMLYLSYKFRPVKLKMEKAPLRDVIKSANQ